MSQGVSREALRLLDTCIHCYTQFQCLTPAGSGGGKWVGSERMMSYCREEPDDWGRLSQSLIQATLRKVGPKLETRALGG